MSTPVFIELPILFSKIEKPEPTQSLHADIDLSDHGIIIEPDNTPKSKEELLPINCMINISTLQAFAPVDDDTCELIYENGESNMVNFGYEQLAKIISIRLDDGMLYG